MAKVLYQNATLADTWSLLYQFLPEDNGFGNLGSGSDYTAFLQLGIGALDFGFGPGRKDAVYHYHSNYDSYAWMQKVDPGMDIHAACGRFMTLLAYHLADDVIVPFDMSAYARNVNYWVRDFVVSFDAETVRKVGGEELDAAAKMFRLAADEFMDGIEKEGFRNDTARVKGVNHKMRDLQRLFVREEGLPGRAFYKNALYAPNRDDGYKALMLPVAWEAVQDGKLEVGREWNMWLVERLGQAVEMLKL